LEQLALQEANIQKVVGSAEQQIQNFFLLKIDPLFNLYALPIFK